MFEWLNQWSKRWAGWISDADLERALRAELTQGGYYGDTAKFITFRLVAIKRPGWLQVFSFSVEARLAKSDSDEREIVKLFGLVRQDERYSRCDIQLFRNAGQRNGLYQAWTEDMIRLRRPNL